MNFQDLQNLSEAYLEVYGEEFEPLPEHLQRINKEQVDIYDIILSHLLDEGYAETPEAAERIMVNMSEDWKDEIVESRGEDLRLKYGNNPSVKLSQRAFMSALNTPNNARYSTGETGTDRKRSLLTLSGAAKIRSRGEMPQGNRKIKSRGGAKPVIGTGENRDRGDKEERLLAWTSGRRTSPNMNDSERRLRHGR